MTKKKYTIELERTSEHTSLVRTNDGFDVFELIGVLEMAKNSLIKQFEDSCEEDIDKVERKIVKTL